MKPDPSKLTPQEKAAMVKAVTKALGYTENGGKPNLSKLNAGKTGELKSIFQFTPDTWKKEAQKYLGNANEPLTPDAETTVVSKQVGDWIDKGFTIKQMASMWNAGTGEPDAYTGKFSDGSPSIGINKTYGVKFNVPAYANSVANYATQFYNQSSSQQASAPSQPMSQAPQQPVATTQTSGTTSGMLPPRSVPGA